MGERQPADDQPSRSSAESAEAASARPQQDEGTISATPERTRARTQQPPTQTRSTGSRPSATRRTRSARSQSRDSRQLAEPEGTNGSHSPIRQSALGLVAAAVGAVSLTFFGPFGNEITSWVEDTFGWGKAATESEVGVGHPDSVSLCGGDWAMPLEEAERAKAELREHKGDDQWPGGDMDAWLNDHQAAERLNSRIYLDLFTDSSQKAVLHDVRIKVTARTPAPKMEAFDSCPPPHATQDPEHVYYRTMDIPLHALPVGHTVSVKEIPRWSGRPGASTSTSSPAEGEPMTNNRPMAFPLALSAQDPASLIVQAFTDRGLCEWEIYMVISTPGNGGFQTKKVDFSGHPFRTVAPTTYKDSLGRESHGDPQGVPAVP